MRLSAIEKVTISIGKFVLLFDYGQLLQQCTSLRELHLELVAQYESGGWQDCAVHEETVVLQLRIEQIQFQAERRALRAALRMLPPCISRIPVHFKGCNCDGSRHRHDERRTDIRLGLESKVFELVNDELTEARARLPSEAAGDAQAIKDAVGRLERKPQPEWKPRRWDFNRP
ncbi:uncharacterized protein LTR77_004113 [Saxophila tyrrhenica]|uniref:Uncharacterized protein n=1 Tax=Saxophila tyrrhenica TaxID=1690608 RepID=A0AAV9PC25_9PEZI|nr:hypothetical protein LTR77_004113 [Saxophila tyrrhenica]